MPGPCHQHNQDEAFDEIEGEEGLRALDEIRRDNDGRQKAYPRVEPRARCQREDHEEQQRDYQDVGDLRIADARHRLGSVHADICATAQQVAIVADQDKRRESHALAKSL